MEQRLVLGRRLLRAGGTRQLRGLGARRARRLRSLLRHGCPDGFALPRSSRDNLQYADQHADCRRRDRAGILVPRHRSALRHAPHANGDRHVPAGGKRQLLRGLPFGRGLRNRHGGPVCTRLFWRGAAASSRGRRRPHGLRRRYRNAAHGRGLRGLRLEYRRLDRDD